MDRPTGREVDWLGLTEDARVLGRTIGWMDGHLDGRILGLTGWSDTLMGGCMRMQADAWMGGCLDGLMHGGLMGGRGHKRINGRMDGQADGRIVCWTGGRKGRICRTAG